jgi:hypothetical protein
MFSVPHEMRVAEVRLLLGAAGLRHAFVQLSFAARRQSALMG